jgi:hypothetical protein
MRHFQGLVVIAFINLAFFLTSCVDPTDLGSDLLNEDRAEVNFIDTLTLIATIVEGEPQFVYGPTIAEQQSSYLLGKMTDPIFGTSTSTIYAQPRLDFFNPDFSNTKLDSVVLLLPYNTDTLAYYGTLNQEFSVEVKRITESFDRNRFYFSDTSFSVDAAPIGLSTFMPRPFDSLNIVQYRSTFIDTVQFPPHLRIPLSEEFGNELLQLDSASLDNDAAFLDFFSGFRVEATTETRGMLSFNLLNTLGGIYLYYTKDDTLKREFLVQLDQFSARFCTFEHDYSASLVENFIGDSQLGDSLLFVQGLAGLDTKIEIPHVRTLEDLIINKAELIVQLEDLPEDIDSVYTPALQLGLFAKRSDGVRDGIEDFLIAGSVDAIPSLFGGINSDPDGRNGTYTMNLSAHFQKMITGEVENVIYLSAFPKSERAYRSVLKGVKNIKLRIAYSRLN